MESQIKVTEENYKRRELPCEIDPEGACAPSDFNQWVEAMKMVACLPGGMPPEFRKKLWLALAEKYLETAQVDWEKEEQICFSEESRKIDEELDEQIVKDLHRTGSSLCSGPAGSINQGKLKRILLGYARWNPEVGYCQGFNMLGALILQVMDKNESNSIKVMIFLIEGVLPQGYFSGSLSGLQADMAVFRELLTSNLPELSKHLQKLQGSLKEGSLEPPLINVFTMQWFLTLFSTCLPINCVLRVWDLILIEGSDVLLRTALALWSLLERKIFNCKTADDFYCKMGKLCGELLNGHLIDSNGLIERVVKLGRIADLPKLRDKHLCSLKTWDENKELRIFYSDEEADSDDDWHLHNKEPPSRPTSKRKLSDHKDRLALDISLLKKQYERLRERQRQAHIILTSAVARQGKNQSSTSSVQVNQLLLGRNAILINKGRRIGPPKGSVPPVRKASIIKNTTIPSKHEEDRRKNFEKEPKRHKTIKNATEFLPKTKSISNINSAKENLKDERDREQFPSSVRVRTKSESSSYSEESDITSSTSTSLCDEDEMDNNFSSSESSPLRLQQIHPCEVPKDMAENLSSKENGSQQLTIKSDKNQCDIYPNSTLQDELRPLSIEIIDANSIVVALEDNLESPAALSEITSTSQLSPIADISTYLIRASISPLKTPSSYCEFSDLTSPIETTEIDIPHNYFEITDEGVTNEYFERVNVVELPKKIDITNLQDNIDESNYSRTQENFKNDLTSNTFNYVIPEYLDIDFPSTNDFQKSSETDLSHNETSVEVNDPEMEHNDLFNENKSMLLDKSNEDYEKDLYSIVSNKSIPRDISFSLEQENVQTLSCTCSENENIGSDHSDKVLKIIQENSQILHKILQKNVNDSDENFAIKKTEYLNIEAEYGSTDFSLKNNFTNFELKEPNNSYEKLFNNKSDEKTYSAVKNRSLTFKSEDNIADRLASIKNTIKSIDSLCDDRGSYKNDKFQKYIDSLFVKTDIKNNECDSAKSNIDRVQDFTHCFDKKESTLFCNQRCTKNNAIYNANSKLDCRNLKLNLDSTNFEEKECLVLRETEQCERQRNLNFLENENKVSNLLPFSVLENTGKSKNYFLQNDKNLEDTGQNRSSPEITKDYLESLKPNSSKDKSEKSKLAKETSTEYWVEESINCSIENDSCNVFDNTHVKKLNSNTSSDTKDTMQQFNDKFVVFKN